MKQKLKQYLKLMRVRHYIKNLLIFIPLLFSKQLFDMTQFIMCIMGFFIFSLVSSIVYIINDIRDVEEDKKHPVKKTRPIASGQVTKNEAYGLIVVLVILIIMIHALFIIIKHSINIYSVLIILLYFVLNLLYSISLKNYVIIDVVILVSGFLLRVVYGASIILVSVSNWLYLTILSFSFYLGLGKRRNELTKSSNITRKVLKKYNKNFLDKNMYLFLTLTIAFYSLWCIDSITIATFGNQNLFWSVPLVIVVCMKYSLNIEGDSHGDPTDVLLEDKVLVGLVLLYVIIMIGFIYC